MVIAEAQHQSMKFRNVRVVYKAFFLANFLEGLVIVGGVSFLGLAFQLF